MYFRVDMNQTIASGHVMRCLAIADAFKEYGEESVFVLADDEAKTLIESKGYQTRVLNSNWNQMELELDALACLIKDERVEELFVDSYQVTERYLREIKKYVKLIYLDDLDLMIYPVDILICYSRYKDTNVYQRKYFDTTTKVCLGTKYVPLRKEFRDVKKRLEKDKNRKRVLITTGGMDSYNVAGQILGTIYKDRDNDYFVVCGKQNRNYHLLREFEKKYVNIKILYDVQGMARLMRKMDCALSATGTTAFELSACKVPTICYTIADNQLELANFLNDEGVMIYAGDFREPNDKVLDNIEREIKLLLNDENRRGQMIQKMANLVDGYGALNIVEEIRKNN